MESSRGIYRSPIQDIKFDPFPISSLPSAIGITNWFQRELLSAIWPACSGCSRCWSNDATKNHQKSDFDSETHHVSKTLRACLDITVPFHFPIQMTLFPSVSKRREGHFHSRNGRLTERSHFYQTGPQEFGKTIP